MFEGVLLPSNVSTNVVLVIMKYRCKKVPFGNQNETLVESASIVLQKSVEQTEARQSTTHP